MQAQDRLTDTIIDRRFDVSPGSHLDISNVSGSVNVRAGEPDVITMHAVKSGSDRSQANTVIEIAQDGNSVQVKTTQASQRFGILSQLGSPCSVNFELRVPPDCRVSAHAVSSSIAVSELNTDLTLHSVSGGIDMADITGDCTVSNVSGKIQGRRLAGALIVNTTSGSTDIRDSRIASANLNSVSGGCTLETPLFHGRHYFAKTVSGNMKLKVPPDTGASIQLKTVSGKVVVSGLPANALKSGPKGWSGRVGDGGASVEMHSVSGSIQVEGSGEVESGQTPDRHGSTVSPRAAQTESQSMDVLRALQDGDLTVEEALQRLEHPAGGDR
ncbi:MAG: DUF4097 family beta strand repeat-containing protein [Chloroflexota bacterium]